MAIHWDPNWPEGRKKVVMGACERINDMLTKAFVAVKGVKTDGGATRAAYSAHFLNTDHLELVSTVIRQMHVRIVTDEDVIMHHVADEAAFNALGIGPLPGGVNMKNVEAFVIQRGLRRNEALHVFISPAFFTADVYIPRNPDQRSGTGTLLHELSHGVAATKDHAYTWDPAYAALTAAERAENADTYRAYCQSFDLLYRPAAE